MYSKLELRVILLQHKAIKTTLPCYGHVVCVYSLKILGEYQVLITQDTFQSNYKILTTYTYNAIYLKIASTYSLTSTYSICLQQEYFVC